MTTKMDPDRGFNYGLISANLNTALACLTSAQAILEQYDKTSEKILYKIYWKLMTVSAKTQTRFVKEVEKYQLSKKKKGK